MQSGISTLLPNQSSDTSDSNGTDSATSLPVSLNSSTHSSPRHIVDDKFDNLITLRQSDDTEDTTNDEKVSMNTFYRANFKGPLV